MTIIENLKKLLRARCRNNKCIPTPFDRPEVREFLGKYGWNLISDSQEHIIPGCIYVYFCTGDNRYIYQAFSTNQEGVLIQAPFEETSNTDGWMKVRGIAYLTIEPYSEHNASWKPCYHPLSAGDEKKIQTTENTIQLVAYKNRRGATEYLLNWYYTDDLLGEFKDVIEDNPKGIKDVYDDCAVIGYYEIFDVELAQEIMRHEMSDWQ